MLVRQFQLTRIFGIPLIIDYSWPPIAILHVWLIANFWLPIRLLEPPPWLGLTLGLIITVLFFVSVLIHELAHSLIARLEGMQIQDIQLHIFGGWARLVGEPRTAMAEFRVAIAGPASSFILSMIFAAFFQLFRVIGTDSWLVIGGREACYYLGFANLFLAVFNLLPGLPLDGGRALRALLWHRRKDLLSATLTAKKIGVAIAYILMFWSVILVVNGAMSGRLWQDFLVAVWLMIIGLFLKNAAESDYRQRKQQVANNQAKAGDREQWNITGTVGAVMSAPAMSVSPELRIDEFIDRILTRYRQINFAVANDGRLHGILSLARLRDVPKEEWERLTVADVMEPISDDLFVTVRSSIEHAQHKLKNNPIGYLAVIDPDGILVGSLSEGDIKRAA
ncbi:MAG: site-2 protease family protein [Acidobacteria bacterium]|nr:site-2 protease family protein [Acidobacteriota bacterium]